MNNKRYDLVLFGATGFTGSLVAEYLARQKAAELRWALAGRDQAKLAAVRARLATLDPRLATLPLITADSRDEAALRALCEQTRVVCTTVGPYALHGRGLVAACVAAGCDYCDLTGEVQFIRDMIDQHQEAARKSGARIVHCCGFDSIPSDLGVYMMYKDAQSRGARLRAVKHHISAMNGGFSGGTLASILNLVEELEQRPALRRVVEDPYALSPNPATDRGPDGGDQRGLRFDRDLQRYTAPFIMAAINSRVVRRSHALLGHAYGSDFSYHEAMSFPSGPSGLLRGALATLAQGAGVVVLGTPLRRVIRRFLPQPGQGPSAEEQRRGYFRTRLMAQLDDGSLRTGVVEGHGDPGYSETAKMLGESALCLAQDPPQSEGGILTPAVALGSLLLSRLRQAGLTFALQDR